MPGVYPRAVTSLRTLIDTALARLAQVGADPEDDEETRLRKALLLLICVLILPISLIWGTLYLAFGTQAGYIAYLYFAIVVGGIVVFTRTRNVTHLLRVQLLAIVLAPTLSMIPLGGFLASGGVGLWGIMAPLGALVFADTRSGVRWYVAFLVVFLGSGIVGEASGITTTLPAWFLSTMLALNITVGGTMVFTLLALFAKQREDALLALRGEQAKADNLLLNILPRSIAEKLKAQPETIADQFTRGIDPVRRRRRLHATVGAPLAGRGRRSARSPVQPLRHPGGAIPAGEDQDDRRRLHGGCGRADASAGSRPGARPHGARHAGRHDDGRGYGRPRPRAPDRDQFRPRRGRRHRPEAVPL